MTGRPRPPVVAGWEVLQHLGSGGMGDVWKARRQDGIVAALKVVRRIPAVSQAEVASHFRREASACLHLDHPNLVRALDAGLTADGAAYLALEFVEGRTLRETLAAEGALDEARVLAIGIALARALAEVHRLGLVHRDVTPRNVILSGTDGVKLLDLGLVVEAEEEFGERTMGTPGFVAPEVAAGARADPRADLYALGATLASAATGELPGGEAPGARATQRRRMSPGLRQVVQRLLHEDPAARYGTAAEVALDLEALAAGERPLGAILGASGARVVRRGPWIAAAVAVLLAAGAAIWALARRGDDPGGAARPEVVPPSVTPTASPAVPRHPALAAAALFVARFPDDFPRGRALLAEADAASLSDDEREDLARLQRDLEARFAAAADREHAERTARLTAAAEAGDVPEASRIAVEWPKVLAGSPRQLDLLHAANVAGAGVIRANEALAADADLVLRAALERPSEAMAETEPAALAAMSASVEDLVRGIDAALARPAFEGDRREPLKALLPRMKVASADLAAACVAGEALTRWRRALAEHLESPTPARLREAFAAGSADAVPAATRDVVRAVAEASERADTSISSRLAALRTKTWCGPCGAALACVVVAEAPSADEVFLAPLWADSGGRAAAVVRAASGADEGAAWLLARGFVEEARVASGPDGAVTRLLVGPPRAAPVAPGATSWPAGVDVAMALRAVGSREAPGPSHDPVGLAWRAAVAGVAAPAPGASPQPASSSRNPAKAAGRDAFLDGTLEAAARSLTEAAAADPRDAEIAALRGRTWLAAARSMPTAPAFLAAFSEGRRAWDLEPRLPAGPLLAAEAGIDLLDLAGADIAERARPVVAASCEAAGSLGRADTRMLLFAGEFHLDGGRAPQAAVLLRRAAALSPNSGRAAFLLARAEHAAGRPERAREALRRARDLLGKDLPASAAELARALGM